MIEGSFSSPHTKEVEQKPPFAEDLVLLGETEQRRRQHKMAEVAVSTVVTKLTELLVEQAAVAAVSVSQLAGVREQVENLKNELGWMQKLCRLTMVS